MFKRELWGEHRPLDLLRWVIGAALSTDKADLSRYISIAKQIPEELAQTIGPAQKVGRSRWQAMAELIANPEGQWAAEKAIKDEVFLALDSEGRFAFLFDKLSSREHAAADSRIWSTPAGQKAAKIDIRSERTILSFDEGAVPDFGSRLNREGWNVRSRCMSFHCRLLRGRLAAHRLDGVFESIACLADPAVQFCELFFELLGDIRLKISDDSVGLAKALKRF